jgi:hypothetical protein
MANELRVISRADEVRPKADEVTIAALLVNYHSTVQRHHRFQ